MTPIYSVVIPLKNEEGNIRALVQELEPIMIGLCKPWELICIDDGSTDQTRSILEELAAQKPYLRVLLFTRNFGQSSAFDAGFKAAQGEYIITLDGDRQNDPADIPRLAAAIPECDLVCGWRVNRRDTWLKRLTSKIANGLRSRLCEDHVHDTGCSLKIYRTQCLRQIKMFQGMHRFLPALFALEGFRIKEIPVNHRPRIEGKTNYTLWNRSFAIWDMLAVRWMRARHLHYEVEKNND